MGSDIIQLLVWLVIALVPTGIFSLIALYLVADIIIKKKVRGGTLVVFWDANREEVSHLIKLRGRKTFRIPGESEEDDRGEYTINPNREYFRYWPPGFPNFLQQRVITYYYRHDVTEPVDPLGVETFQVISPRMLRSMANESVLKATIQDARETAEGSLVNRRRMPIFILVSVGVLALIVIVNLFFTFSTSDQIGEVKTILQGLGPGTGGS